MCRLICPHESDIDRLARATLIVISNIDRVIHRLPIASADLRYEVIDFDRFIRDVF